MSLEKVEAPLDFRFVDAHPSSLADVADVREALLTVQDEDVRDRRRQGERRETQRRRSTTTHEQSTARSTWLWRSACRSSSACA
jgi:hypothetical protein